MTKSGEESRYRVWLQQGYYDVEAAKDSFKAGSYEWSCYQSVQATEKILKAVIVHAGWSPPQTHKLGVLVSIGNKANKVFLNVKLNFRKLEAYTFISRYPFVYPSQKNITPHDFITKQDAAACLDIASDVFQKVNDFLSKGASYPTEFIDINEFYFTPQEIEDRLSSIISTISQAERIKVDKIILFGGFAREKSRPRTSTMDIIIVGQTEMNFVERLEYIRELTKGTEPIVEPLVYTPEEFDFMLLEEGEGFLESAIEEGKEIFKRNTIVQE